MDSLRSEMSFFSVFIKPGKQNHKSKQETSPYIFSVINFAPGGAQPVHRFDRKIASIFRSKAVVKAVALQRLLASLVPFVNNVLLVRAT